MKLTAAQKRDKWRSIINAVIDTYHATGAFDLDTAIGALETVDQYGKIDPFYSFVNLLDKDYQLLKASQGDPKALHTVLDLMVSHISAYDQLLREQEAVK